jgi:hypothetical protein
MGTAECWLRERSAVWHCAGLQSTAAGGGNRMQERCMAFFFKSIPVWYWSWINTDFILFY